MRAKEYQLMVETVEAGETFGLNRAFKHSDNPTPESIIEAISQAVMDQINEKWSFDDENSKN